MHVILCCRETNMQSDEAINVNRRHNHVFQFYKHMASTQGVRQKKKQLKWVYKQNIIIIHIRVYFSHCSKLAFGFWSNSWLSYKNKNEKQSLCEQLFYLLLTLMLNSRGHQTNEIDFTAFYKINCSPSWRNINCLRGTLFH